MSNSWDDYFSYYSDWDDTHCFNVRIELEFEDKLTAEIISKMRGEYLRKVALEKMDKN